MGRRGGVGGRDGGGIGERIYHAPGLALSIFWEVNARQRGKPSQKATTNQHQIAGGGAGDTHELGKVPPGQFVKYVDEEERA